MPVCIYCKCDKENFQKREHVIPQAFGNFSIPGNFILNDKIKKDNTVCDDCNAKFGNELETFLGRDSYEGYVGRSHHLNKKHDSFYRRRIIITIAEGSYAGVKVELATNRTITPLPQIGLRRKDGSWDYFLLGEIRNINLCEYNTTCSNAFRAFGLSDSEAIDAFKKLGVILKKEGNLPAPNGNDILCEISGIIDKVIYRAIAKIAFNYFVYHNNNKTLILKKDFDDIRDFITLGVGKCVTVANEAILADEQDERTRRLGHIVLIEKKPSNSIIAQVSLYNEFSYKVIISSSLDSYCGIKLDFGHFFNICTGKIEEMAKVV